MPLPHFSVVVASPPPPPSFVTARTNLPSSCTNAVSVLFPLLLLLLPPAHLRKKEKKEKEKKKKKTRLDSLSHSWSVLSLRPFLRSFVSPPSVASLNVCACVYVCAQITVGAGYRTQHNTYWTKKITAKTFIWLFFI